MSFKEIIKHKPIVMWIGWGLGFITASILIWPEQGFIENVKLFLDYSNEYGLISWLIGTILMMIFAFMIINFFYWALKDLKCRVCKRDLLKIPDKKVSK